MTETLWPDSVSVGDASAMTARLTDAVLERLLAAPPGLEARVYDAMRYSALAPGKRLRPLRRGIPRQDFSIENGRFAAGIIAGIV